MFDQQPDCVYIEHLGSFQLENRQKTKATIMNLPKLPAVPKARICFRATFLN